MAVRKRRRTRHKHPPSEPPLSGWVVALVLLCTFAPVVGFVYLTYRDWADDHHAHIHVGVAFFVLALASVGVWAAVQWWLTRRR